MKIFIMAQGDGSRWKENTKIELPSEYKQLIPLGKETIITRTLRQLEGYDITVIADGYFAPFMPENIKLVYFRVPGCLLRGIWQTRSWWGESGNVFLLGDVVYSNELLRKIVKYSTEISIFGRLGENKVTGKEAKELFALNINFCDVHDRWIEDTLKSLYESNPRAKLWDFQESVEDEVIESNDYTDDLDSPEEYLQFWNKLEKSALEDDNRQ